MVLNILTYRPVLRIRDPGKASQIRNTVLCSGCHNLETFMQDSSALSNSGEYLSLEYVRELLALNPMPNLTKLVLLR
jgi:hypothetical protein